MSDDGFFSGVVSKLEGKPNANTTNVATIKTALADAQAAAAKVAAAIAAAAEEGLADFVSMLEGATDEVKAALLNAGISKLTSLLPSS